MANAAIDNIVGSIRPAVDDEVLWAGVTANVERFVVAVTGLGGVNWVAGNDNDDNEGTVSISIS